MSSPQERATGATGYEGEAPSQSGGAHRQGTAPRDAAARQPGFQAGYEARERELVSTGFTVLAATLMILSGLWGFFLGITAVLQGGFYSAVPTYTFSLGMYWWGIIQTGIGGLIFVAGVSLLLGMSWARVAGVALSVFSGLANFLFLPHYPIWSIIVIALDVIIIWALTTSRVRRLV